MNSNNIACRWFDGFNRTFMELKFLVVEYVDREAMF